MLHHCAEFKVKQTTAEPLYILTWACETRWHCCPLPGGQTTFTSVDPCSVVKVRVKTAGPMVAQVWLAGLELFLFISSADSSGKAS